MKAARDHPKQEEPASWLTTFGDLATLLLTFYVLIYASCTYRPGQWETARSALERILAVLPGKSGAALVVSEGHGALPGQTAAIPLFGGRQRLTQAELSAVETALDGMVELATQERYQGMVEIEGTQEGLVFRVAEPIAFEIGSASLNLAIHPILRSVAKVVRAAPGNVVVEGHTCDLPIHTRRFASNWDLAGARSAEVVRFLLKEGIGDAPISARACGEYYPRVPNMDEDGRRRNRRVEIQVSFRQSA